MSNAVVKLCSVLGCQVSSLEQVLSRPEKLRLAEWYLGRWDIATMHLHLDIRVRFARLAFGIQLETKMTQPNFAKYNRGLDLSVVVTTFGGMYPLEVLQVTDPNYTFFDDLAVQLLQL